MRLLIPVVAGTLATASALGSRLLDVALLSIPSRPSAPAWTRGFACMLRVHGRARHGREARRRARQAGVDRVRSCSARAGDCPCSVREQPPTHTDSNQERAGNVLKLSEVTDAPWSLSLPEADYEICRRTHAARAARAPTRCVHGVCPDPHHPSPSQRQIDDGRARHHGGLMVWDGVVHAVSGTPKQGVARSIRAGGISTY